MKQSFSLQLEYTGLPSLKKKKCLFIQMDKRISHRTCSFTFFKFLKYFKPSEQHSHPIQAKSRSEPNLDTFY